MGTIKRTFANNILTSGKLDATDLFGTIPASNIDDTTVSAVTALPSAVGDAIESTATDPVSPSEGQLWYNSSEGKLKIYGLVADAWASGGNLNTARSLLAGAGASTQTAGLVFGGNPGPTQTGVTESYNGTSWTNSPSSIPARQQLGGAGTQTAALAFGGYGGTNLNTAFAYNGSIWTSTGSMNTSRNGLAGTGIQTAALGFGGYTTSVQSATEAFNGSTWTSVNGLSTARTNLGSAGTQTSALAFGGRTPGGVESYNGTSWTAGGVLNNSNSDREGIQGAGASNTSAIAFGGNNALSSTEKYNGTSWTTSTNLSNGRKYLAGLGTQSAALAAGGNPGPGAVTATEEFTGAFLSNKNVTIS
jgi:hypothetical protein